MLRKNEKDLIISLCDFTEEAMTALNHATKIALQSLDEVRLLHIVGKKGHTIDSANAEMKKIADENYASNNVKTTFAAVEGNIFTTVGEYVKEHNVSLVVFGTHGVKGMQRIVGANSLKVILSCECPVIVVQNKKADYHGYKKIVLPIDSSRFGRNKITHAVAVAKYFNSQIEIFEEVSSDTFTTNQIKHNLGMAENLLKFENITYNIVQESSGKGSFEKQLIKYATSVDADLITISSQADGDDIGSMFFGNHEVEIINNDAEIAVLVINLVKSSAGGIAGIN